MRDLARDGMTMLVVTHNAVRPRGRRPFDFMDEGRIVEEGKPVDVSIVRERRGRGDSYAALSSGRIS